MYKAKGTVVNVSGTQDITPKFSIRKLLITWPVEFSNSVVDKFLEIDFANDRGSLLDSVSPGEEVEVSFDIESRQGKNNDRYFTSVKGWSVKPIVQHGDRPAPAPQTASQAPSYNRAPVNTPSPQQSMTVQDAEDDDLPF